jgi:transcriptional regulator with XRE-family HTH domain
MVSPGENLKQEREARGKSIEEMAEATGIRLDLLTALEQEAFEALPGRGFAKLYIRAYAEVLGFDPRPIIDAYDRALRRQAVEPTPAPASAPRPVEAALARWRQERMAGRTEADLSEEPEEAPFDQPAVPEPETEEQEPEPETFDEPTVVEREDEPEREPELMEEPAVQTMPVPPDPTEELIADEPAVALPVEEARIAVQPTRSPARSGWWRVASVLLLVLLPLMAYVVFSRSKTDPPPIAAKPEPAPAQAVPPPPSLAPPPQAVEPPRTPPRTQVPARAKATPSSLTVAESGVGLRLVGTSVEGESDSFRPGQRVTFATRVLGGRAGERIRHVWMRDGNVEQSIRLGLGGSSWRTHSTKTLGRAGAWAVEARDDDGQVLARADFTVAP